MNISDSHEVKTPSPTLPQKEKGAIRIIDFVNLFVFVPSWQKKIVPSWLYEQNTIKVPLGGLRVPQQKTHSNKGMGF